MKLLVWLSLMLVLALNSPAAVANLDIHQGVPAIPQFSSVQSDSGVLHATIKLPEGETKLRLWHNRSLLAQLPGLAERIRAKTLLLEGSVEGKPGSWAAFSVSGDQWSGLWYDGHQLRMLDPASKFNNAGAHVDPRQHVAYDLQDLDSLDFGMDATFPTFLRNGLLAPRASAHDRTQDATLKELKLTVVTDTEFTDMWGEDRDAMVASRLNIVDGLYRSQLGVRIALIHLEHLTDNGEMTTTNPYMLFSLFRVAMRSAEFDHIPHLGLTHLFSGKNFDGGTAGVAKIGVLCNDVSGYAINQITLDRVVSGLIVAHEMGHNFGASHDGASGSVCHAQEGNHWLMSRVMYSDNTQFSPCSLHYINPQIDAAVASGCLVEVDDIDLLFKDGFDTNQSQLHWD